MSDGCKQSQNVAEFGYGRFKKKKKLKHEEIEQGQLDL
jgi:hypothetical protein